MSILGQQRRPLKTMAAMSGPRQPLFAPMAHAAAASPIAEVSGSAASGAARGSLRMAAQHSTGARIKASTRRRPPAALLPSPKPASGWSTAGRCQLPLCSKR